MSKRGRRLSGGQRAAQRMPMGAREALERRWHKRVENRPDLADLVTGRSLAEEPFHRWLSYKQAFAPGLVRRFLKEADVQPAEDRPVLDPFAGTGTVAVECARQGVAGAGVDVTASLVYVAAAKAAREFPPLPDLRDCKTQEQMADRLAEPVHRAALICAVAAGHNTDGSPNRGASSLKRRFVDVATMMAEDLERPLSGSLQMTVGDARDLADFDEASVAGALTSPPYLSRHDYTKITRPHETVYAYWHGDVDWAEARGRQVRAHPKAHAQQWSAALPDAAWEAVNLLQAEDALKLAGVVRSYFDDMAAALSALARVLVDGAPCWLAVGGARLGQVYVPADLIIAEQAEQCGFAIEAVWSARRLIGGGRRLGGLTDTAPRETVLVLRRRAACGRSQPVGPLDR